MADNRKSEPQISYTEKRDETIRAAQQLAEQNRKAEEIPAPLFKIIVTNFLIAGLVLIVTVVFAVTMKKATFAVLLVFSAYLVYAGFSTAYDYRHGKIHERILECVSVNRKSFLMRRYAGVQIIMQDPTVTPVKVYEFYYPQNGCPFAAQSVYTVYTHDDQPRKIVAWKSV